MVLQPGSKMSAFAIFNPLDLPFHLDVAIPKCLWGTSWPNLPTDHLDEKRDFLIRRLEGAVRGLVKSDFGLEGEKGFILGGLLGPKITKKPQRRLP